MEIQINDVLKSVQPESRLLDVVFSQVKEKTQGIAVAVNGQVVPQPQWHETQIQPNDQILIIKATQGG